MYVAIGRAYFQTGYFKHFIAYIPLTMKKSPCMFSLFLYIVIPFP